MTDYPLCASLDCYDCVQKTRAILKAASQTRMNKGVIRNESDSMGNGPNFCQTCGEALSVLANKRRKFCGEACRQKAYRRASA